MHFRRETGRDPKGKLAGRFKKENSDFSLSRTKRLIGLLKKNFPVCVQQMDKVPRDNDGVDPVLAV